MMTLTLVAPWATLDGAAEAGVAGGGARSLVTWTPHESVALQNSWNVQMVWSSAGSTTVAEKSPQRWVPPWRLYEVVLVTRVVGAWIVPRTSPLSLPALAVSAN